jgi:hypothetical protein
MVKGYYEKDIVLKTVVSLPSAVNAGYEDLMLPILKDFI